MQYNSLEILLLSENMEFITERKDYNVAEFHNMFYDKLPKFVKISQGYFGDIAADVFDRDQVLRIEAASKQQRVIAKMKFKANQERLLSIPATFAEKLCVVKHGKVGKEKYLQNILMDHHLPLTVRFPKDRTITVGYSSLHTSLIPNMELTNTFDEVYLLGNFIVEGVLHCDVVPVPLYLSQLRLALITGIKDQPEYKWKGYQEGVARTCATVEYDLSFGNPNIAEYDPSAIHSDATYSYVEPCVYSNIVSIIQRPVRRNISVEEKDKGSGAQNDDQDLYEEIQNTSHSKPDPIPSISTSTFAKELKSRLKSTKNKKASDLTADAKEEKHGGPPPIAPKPKIHLHDDGAPVLPKRREKSQICVMANVPDNHYSNDVPRTIVKPSISKPEEPPIVDYPAKQVDEDSNTVTADNVAMPNVKTADDVSKLTIDEVSVCMNRLGLGQYEKAFRDEMVDGALLNLLDKDMLREDFGMKGVEAIRLMKFVKDGHIPV
ncbi:hypothetical protein ACF0H5_022821 [Mactra antiquata]